MYIPGTLYINEISCMFFYFQILGEEHFRKTKGKEMNKWNNDNYLNKLRLIRTLQNENMK